MYQPNRKSKIMFLALFLITCTFIMTSFALSISATYEGNDLGISMSEILNSPAVSELKTIIVTMVNPIASVSLGATILGLVISKSQKQAENLLKGIKAIVWGFVLCNSLGLILSTIGNIIGNHAYTFT